MEILSPSCWPLWFICLAMIAEGVIDWWLYKVPNWLTFPVIISGWVLGLIHTLGGHIVTGDGIGGIGDSLAGMMVGSALLLVYMLGWLGAGDVKMSMGFGSWLGAFFGINPGYLHILLGLCIGIIVGGIIALGMIAVRGQYRQNLQNAQSMLLDLFTAGSIGKVAAKAKQRRPRWHRLPYGVPLCIGFVGYLWLAHPLEKKMPVGEAVSQNSLHLAQPADPHFDPMGGSRIARFFLGPYRTQT